MVTDLIDLRSAMGQSPWHHQYGVAILTALLRKLGHKVRQRFSHILALEYVLRMLGGAKAVEALAVIRDPKSDVHALYEARMTLERISGRILPDEHSDQFAVLRTNVHYSAAGYDGTVESLVSCIENGDRNLWNEYITEIEVPMAVASQPTLYGISINDERQLVPGWLLARRIHEACRDTLVVIGGNFWARMEHAYKLPEFAKLFAHCDAIVYAEGFQPLSELAETLDPCSVPGVVWFDGNNVVVNKKTTTPTPFDDLPTPHFDGGATIWCPDDVLPLYTISNCPFGCSFCGIHAGSDTYEQPPRKMSSMQIAKHMKALGASRFDIFDETFGINDIVNLGHALKAVGHAAVLQCYTIVDKHLVDPKRCKQIYDGGCRAVELGLESLSRKTLSQENKKWNPPEHYSEILENLYNAGIQVHAFIMVGIPGEKISDTMRWLPFIADNDEWVATWKPSRYRLTRMSPEERDEKKRSPLIELLEDRYPLRLNRDFTYKTVNDPRRLRKRKTRTGSEESKGVDSVLKDVEAALVLLEEADRRRKKHALMSTLPWWPNRGRYTNEQLRSMEEVLPEEPKTLYLNEALARIAKATGAELGREVTFKNFEGAVNFFRTL